MQDPATNAGLKPIQSPSQAGYVLYFVITCLAVLSIAAGQILLRVRGSYRAIHRAANWQQAICTAGAGVDMVAAQVSSLLPDIRASTLETASLPMDPTWAAELDLGFTLGLGATSLPAGLDVTLTPPPFIGHGEGNTLQQASIHVSALSLAPQAGSALASLSGVSLQLLKVRSTGIAYLDSSNSAGYESDEGALRKPVLVWDRKVNQFVTRPYVSRTVEAILRPVFAFQRGVSCGGELRVDSDTAEFDSFNSLSIMASTGGLYDPAKRLENTFLSSNSSQVTLPALVFGDVSTNGANIPPGPNITGTISDGIFSPHPPLRSPTWVGNPAAPPQVDAPTVLAAGSAAMPARYKFSSITSELRITKGSLGLGTNVEIWVSGDFAGRLILDPGVKAKVYVEGDLTAGTDDLQNGTHLADHLQVYGLKPQPGKGTMSVALNTDVQACIYAPEHDLVFSGGAHFSGSVTAASIWVKSSAKFHYDEALALNVGPMVGFKVVSWREVSD